MVKQDQGFVSPKTCHSCDHKMLEMALNKRIRQCPECGVEHDHDISAARDIRQKGILALQAAGFVVSAHRAQRKSFTKTVAA
ncbi:putative transposase [Izhakiella capsodis]|uniref:Putative transposase n=1 Tax=Izhakiella capsodis TaxID=1367852 RepID=A0A1I5AUB3_9GAMM|nr:putative transposase [Izhakiella capsodis]